MRTNSCDNLPPLLVRTSLRMRVKKSHILPFRFTSHIVSRCVPLRFTVRCAPFQSLKNFQFDISAESEFVFANHPPQFWDRLLTSYLHFSRKFLQRILFPCLVHCRLTPSSVLLLFFKVRILLLPNFPSTFTTSKIL